MGKWVAPVLTGIVFSKSLANKASFGLFNRDKPDDNPPPQVGDPAVQQAAAEAVVRRSRARGYASTILGSMAQQSGAPALKSTLGS